MKYLNKLMTLAIVVLIASCAGELEYREPIEDNGTIPPALDESTIKIQGLAGAVKISYTLPVDANIAHVSARYALSTGEERTIKSSVYKNFIILEGFADEATHDVELFTVSKSNKQSPSINITVQALEAPLWKVYNSIEVKDHFGGYNLTAQNPDTALVNIYIMEKNEFGAFEVNNLKSFTTSLGEVTSKVRGLDTVRMDVYGGDTIYSDYVYKYFVTDKFGNSTDTTEVTVNPLFETLIDKSKFEPYNLPGDAPQVTNGARLEYAWDNRLLWPWTSFTYQVTGGSGPHTITFDMGVEAKLSRFWYRPYPEYWWESDAATQWFFLTTLKVFEVWGSTAPTQNGQYDDSWILLGEYEIEKPSGSPYGSDTPEDKAIAAAGFDFELDINAPKVRYIRIRCLENWAGGTAQSINELSMFGDPR